MTKTSTAHSLDLRAWLDEVRALGELTEVSGADWNLELGAISELNVKKEKPDALAEHAKKLAAAIAAG